MKKLLREDAQTMNPVPSASVGKYWTQWIEPREHARHRGPERA